MQRAGAETRIAKDFKDIFEVGGVPAFNQFYYFGILIWKAVYRGFYKPWHHIKAPTIENPYAERDLRRLNMAKALCAELAGLVWNEQCEIHVSQGDGDTQPLDDFVQDVLHDNNFIVKMQEHIEQVLALGGGAVKTWYTEKYDRDKNPIPETGHIELGYAMADQFVPTAWDNAKVTDGVFISRQAKGGYYYTRLEWHFWNGLTYYVQNDLYRAERNASGGQNQDILGFHYPLAEIYPMLNESTEINGLENSLFTYYRTPIANNLDDNSPLGVSIFANALDTLRELDVCFDSLEREIRLGKRRIIVPASAVRVVTNEKGQMLRYFDPADEVYEALATDGPDSNKIVDNTVELRIEEHVSALNALLSTLCLQVGFSAGTFTFDQARGIKTATEVISENSKTFKTIAAMQTQLRAAIKSIVENIITVAQLYDVQHNGYSIGRLAAQPYEVKVTFDDSILQDRQTNIREGLDRVASGTMSKHSFLTEIIGMTDDQAQEELRRIAAEQQTGPANVDALFSVGDA